MKTLARSIPFGICLLFSTWIAAQADRPAYEEFRTVYQQNAPAEMRALAAKCARSSVAGDRHLGMLAIAAAAAREEDFGACLAALDSVDANVPATDVIVRSTALRIRSHALTMLGDATRGTLEAEKALRMISGKGLLREQVSLMIVRAEGMLMDGRFDEAFTAFVETEQLADSIGFLSGQASAENGMGLIRLNQRRNAEAWHHFQACLDLGDRSGSEMMVQNALANLGIVATMTGDHQLALRLCDSVLVELGDGSPLFRLMLFTEKGATYMRMRALPEALRELQYALALRDQVGETMHVAKAEQFMGSVLYKLGRITDAFSTMEQALAHAERLGSASLREELHKELYEWNEELGRTGQAFFHLKAYTHLIDSLYQARYSDQLARSEALYGTEKKERRIVEQEQELKLRAVQHDRKVLQRNVSIILAIVLSLLAFSLWRGLVNRKALAARDRELHAKHVDELLHVQENRAMQAMLDGQEQERDRMAKELHDRLGSMLSAIKMQVGALEEKGLVVGKGHDPQYAKVNRMLDEAVGEVRRVSHDMVTTTLSRSGLAKALEDLCDSLRGTGKLDVELKLFGLELRLDRSTETAIYRIVQELVGNVLKHARATEIGVALTRTTGRISVIVSDNGKGFDPSAYEGGIGLKNVYDRAATINALVVVDSTPGEGTSISVEGPVVE